VKFNKSISILLILAALGFNASAGSLLTARGLATKKKKAAAGGFSPSNISGLKFWLKADALALSDGTAVSTWPDSSGNGNNATQSSGALQPIFKAASVNGLGSVLFDTNSNGMVTSLALTKPFTIFVVEKVNSTGSLRRTIQATSPNNSLIAVTARTSGANAYDSGTVSGFRATDATRAHIGRLAIQNSASSYFCDSIDETSGATQYNDWGTIGLGYNTWNPEPCGCYVCEIIIYQGVTLSSTDFSNVEGYLRTKWGTP